MNTEQWRDRALAAEAALVKANSIGERGELIAERNREHRLRVAAELKVEQLEGDVIEEENRANENATLVHEARAERDARIAVLDCNAADLHEDAHVWSLDGNETFVCFGNNAWPDKEAPEWMLRFPPLDEVDHDGVGRPREAGR